MRDATGSQAVTVTLPRLLERLEAHEGWADFVAGWPRAAHDVRQLRAALLACREVGPHDAIALRTVGEAFDGLACALARFKRGTGGAWAELRLAA